MNTNYLYNVESEDKTLQLYYYEGMKNKLNSIVYYLKKSAEYMQELDNTYKKCFSVDEYSSGQFYKIRNEILDRINYLNYTIIPAVKQKIDSLK